MNIEEAINTAISYETKVRDVYIAAMKVSPDPKGRKIFNTLAREEQGHLDYLQQRLAHWKKTGKVEAPALETAVPSKEAIEKGINRLEKNLTPGDRGAELDLLKQALEAETETSGFYRKMVNELSAESRALFTRFLQIEEGHLAIVQAEMDALTGSGYWFDFTDISLEM